MDKTAMEDAIRYISLELNEHPDADKLRLIERAGQQFNLSPMQTEFLINKYILGM